MLLLAQGTKGLSLFYLETKLPDGRFNNLEVQVCCVLLQQYLLTLFPSLSLSLSLFLSLSLIPHSLCRD